MQHLFHGKIYKDINFPHNGTIFVKNISSEYIESFILTVKLY